MTEYAAWHWKAVEGRVIEMADTLRKLPADKGPKAYGSAMPEVVRRYDEENAEPIRVSRAPTGAAIDRMNECFGWINSYLGEPERKLLYAWSWVKVRRGMKIAGLASENDMNERFLRREITSYCQHIADNLNRLFILRLDNGDLPSSESAAENDQSHVTSNICAKRGRSNHWMASDAKPVHDPQSPELVSLRERLTEGNARREALRREKLAREGLL